MRKLSLTLLVFLIIVVGCNSNEADKNVPDKKELDKLEIPKQQADSQDSNMRSILFPN